MEARAYYSDDSEEPNISTTQRVLSVAGGAYLLASGLKGFPDLGALLKSIAGGYLLYRGASGHCALTEYVDTKGKALNIRESLLINKPRLEVYKLWRNLQNLPLFMKHLDSVEILDNNRSHWKLKTPGGIATIGWNAEILIDRPGQELSWRSLEGAAIENSGKIVFEEVYGGQSTELHANIRYNPPAGKVGKAVSAVFNNLFEKLVKEDLKGFKQFAEGGDYRTIDLKTKANGIHV